MSKQRRISGPKGAWKEKDLFLEAQRLRMQEILERIFGLLALICEPSDMRTIHNCFIHDNDHLRAHAIELLDNVIDLELRKVLHVLLNFENSYFYGKVVPPAQVVPLLNKMPLDGADAWDAISAFYMVQQARSGGLVND